MPPPKPHDGAEPLEAQDRSIKARKSQLFEAEDASDGQTIKPFKAYLLTVPAAPVSPVIKGVLWAAAGVVFLLFLAAMFIGPPPKPRRARRPSTAPARHTAIDRGAVPWVVFRA
jgi:hypothetical protein